ncbi:MAG: hypothetical protein V4467_03710 [Patescibacteria group bacterium]
MKKLLSRLFVAVVLFLAALVTNAKEPSVYWLRTTPPIYSKFETRATGVTSVERMWLIGTDTCLLRADFTGDDILFADLKTGVGNTPDQLDEIWSWRGERSGNKYTDSEWIKLAREIRSGYKVIGVINKETAYFFTDHYQYVGRVRRNITNSTSDEYVFMVSKCLSLVPVQNWVGAEPVNDPKLKLASDGDKKQEMFFFVHLQSDGTVLAPLETLEGVQKRKLQLHQAAIGENLTTNAPARPTEGLQSLSSSPRQKSP